MPKKLPLGLQDFRKIIENGFLYVDKTAFLYKIASNPGAYFLSRPRRFGKSITIATLYELYSGSRELFAGLWIEDKWDWSRKNPVLRMTFIGIGFVEQGLEAALHYLLDKNFREHGIAAMSLPIKGSFQLDKAEISALDLECADIENIQPCGLLYQTGYLTIQARDEYGLYHLDYPNREVKLAMEEYIRQAVGSAIR